MQRLIHHWHRFELVEENQTLPDKRQQPVITLLHPGAVVILAQDAQGNIIVERQYRTAIKDWLLELPAGTLEADEQSREGILACAQRELQEEVNLAAAEWHSLGKLYPAPGFCDEIQYLFIAKQLHSKQGQADDDEFIETLRMSCEQFEQAIISGAINDGKSIACYTRAKLLGLLD